jgi:hypothetical protein
MAGTIPFLFWSIIWSEYTHNIARPADDMSIWPNTRRVLNCAGFMVVKFLLGLPKMVVCDRWHVSALKSIHSQWTIQSWAHESVIQITSQIRAGSEAFGFPLSAVISQHPNYPRLSTTNEAKQPSHAQPFTKIIVALGSHSRAGVDGGHQFIITVSMQWKLVRWRKMSHQSAAPSCSNSIMIPQHLVLINRDTCEMASILGVVQSFHGPCINILFPPVWDQLWT